ncbi:MAG: SDR family oxidoreductase [Actinomycetia bacterium]|nr:SDR family oxidoreductase [Actinomycetes bacterium]
MRRLDGRAAMVTGAASGIGAATARRLIDDGASVLLTDIQDEAGERLAASLGERAAYRHCNVVEEDQVSGAISEVVERWGSLDGLHNNAGFAGVVGPIQETPAQGWLQTMDVLVTSVFFGIKHAAPIMKGQGSGSIVSTASVCGLQAGIGGHAYTAAKHAVIGITRSVALELAEYGVRVNAVCPGFIATGLAAGRSVSEVDEAEMANRLDRARAAIDDAQPLARTGEPRDIAAMVAWLMADDSQWVTGTAQVVDGGLITGKPWRKQPGAVTESRPIRLYAPGTYS